MEEHFINSIIVVSNVYIELRVLTKGLDGESPEPLIQAVALSHTAPPENVMRLYRVQGMSESILSFITEVTIRLSAGLAYNSYKGHILSCANLWGVPLFKPSGVIYSSV